MNKKLKIFYYVDVLLIIISFIGLVITNNNDSYGLSALTEIGKFVIWGVIFLFSLILLISVSIVNLVIKRSKKK